MIYLFALHIKYGPVITGYINVREYRRANQKRTIQRDWQHRVHKTKTKTSKTKPQHNMW